IITWGSHYSDINHLSANAWYQLLAHAYRITTWGSHYSDINHVSTNEDGIAPPSIMGWTIFD
ncbi:hypothetical protein BDR05DRAFT_1002797, partial [Suillus weaverae]